MIDVHSHLLPGIDDGCKDVAESIACARALVESGYTHSFCTPHIWPTYGNTVHTIPPAVERLQKQLDDANIPLRLIPGGEINLRPEYSSTPASDVVTYALAREYALIDMWHDKVPEFVAPSIRWLQSLGLTVILAHPERMRAVQDNPSVIDLFTEMGVLLQGNLQCFGDAPGAQTRIIAEQFLAEGRYFMLGSDLHALHSLPQRLRGLQRARELIDAATFDRLTRENPSRLLPG